MSAPTAAAAPAVQSAAAYWRAAGMTYMSYANMCASLLRKCLKEPYKTQSASREQVHYKIAKWENGVPQKPETRGTGEAD